MSSTQEKLEEVKEKLAAIEHERWADWQKWMHNQLTPELSIPYELWERWQKQIVTPYEELPEHSKQSDREQVDRYWPIILALIDSAKREARIEEMQMLQQKAEFMERAGINFKPAAHAHNRLIRLEQSEERSNESKE